jgi:nucleoside-diphosphate-sugar epimerase
VNSEAKPPVFVMSGARGWLGQEFIHAWKGEDPTVEILSTPRLGSDSLHQFATRLDGKPLQTFVHLAFATRERLAAMGETEYVSTNRAITEGAIEVIKRYRPSSVVHASSGAVFDKDDLYGHLKREQEELLQNVCLDQGIPCVNARIWSVSGAFCTKPDEFLFYDLIRQALFSDSVQVRANHEVIRRYVDAGQFLSLAVKLANCGMSLDLDSGGERVTAVELANRIVDVLESDKPVLSNQTSGGSHAYYSSSTDMEKMAGDIGHEIGDITWQILRSKETFALGSV